MIQKYCKTCKDFTFHNLGVCQSCFPPEEQHSLFYEWGPEVWEDSEPKYERPSPVRLPPVQ